MSLKAKIEAVIYASEEPVTLAQLAGLLGVEAQAELDALASRQQRLALLDAAGNADQDFPEADDEDLNAEVLDTEELDTDSPDADTEVSVDGPVPEPFKEEQSEIGSEAGEQPKTPALAAVPAPPDDLALVEKSAAAKARQKDRSLRDYFRELLDDLIGDYASESRGLEIREVAGGFRLATKPEYHDAVRGFVKTLKPPLKLSLQALETLAVVAYKQPVTAPEVSEIRGVDSAGVLGSLMTRKLITTAGRKQVIGRPILYKTTKDFLLRFGLKDINELPSIEEFEKMAGELNAAVQEEIPMEQAADEVESSQGGENEDQASDESSRTSASGSLDELNSAPQPTHMHHDTPEDLLNDKSTALEGRNREHADPSRVTPQTAAEQETLKQDSANTMVDEIDIDGRISGAPPSYNDDSPSAQEAAAQDDENADRQ